MTESCVASTLFADREFATYLETPFDNVSRARRSVEYHRLTVPVDTPGMSNC